MTDLTHPLLGLDRPTELWGVRDPTDLRPTISGRAAEGWYWYVDRPAAPPGVVRLALRGLGSSAEALRQAIARVAARFSARHEAGPGLLVRPFHRAGH
jgi:hypothetical protein